MYPVYTHRVVFKEADPVDNSMDFKIFVNKLISDSNVLGVFFQKLLWVFFFFFFPLVSVINCACRTAYEQPLVIDRDHKCWKIF